MQQRAQRFGRVAQGCIELQLRTDPDRVGRQRHAAAATQPTRDGPLGQHGQERGFVAGLLQQLAQGGVVFAHLQAKRALARGRQHLRGLKTGADACAQAQPHQTRGRQHDGIKTAFVQLAQAGVQVATQGLDAQVGTHRQQLHHAAKAAGADHGTLGQGREAGVVVGDKGIARVFAFPDRGQHKARRQLHGHVFQRVHGQVRLAGFQRRFQFLDEQPFATHLGQRPVQDLVAPRGHAQQLHRQCKAGLQGGAHMFGLPQRQAALTCGDDGG